MPSGTATLDFGAFPGSSDTSLAITGQAGILSGSLVEAYLFPAATADHSADEHMVELLEVRAGNIVVGTGFTIYGVNRNEIIEPLFDPYPDGRPMPPDLIADRRSKTGGFVPLIYGTWNVAWVWI